MSDFLMDKIFPIVIAFMLFSLFLFLGFLMYEIASGDSQKPYLKFMEQCQADGNKEYECTYMWRSGNRSSVSPVVVPMVIK